MAKTTRATKIARPKRATKISRAKAKPHANSLTKPLPRPHGNLLVFAPELMADGKRRYETTPESLDSIALDFGATRSTVRNIAKRENWVRYVPPPRGLSRAAEIAAKAEALETEALNDRHPEVRAAFAASLEGWTAADSGAVARRSRVHPRSDFECASRLAPTCDGAQERAPQGDGEGAPGGEEAAAPPTAPAWSTCQRIDALRSAVDEEIAAVRALRAKLKGVPHSTETAGRTSRTLADLTTTLERLHRLEIGASQHNGQDAYADKFSELPADPDEFRLDLARRIRAFVASRTRACDADGNSGSAAVDEVR